LDHQSRLWREGSTFSNQLPAYPPQREAREEITPEGRRSKTISPREFLLDRPDPMEEKPPQDDDPNFSSLNPKSLLLSPPGAFSTKGSFFKNRGARKRSGRILVFQRRRELTLRKSCGADSYPADRGEKEAQRHRPPVAPGVYRKELTRAFPAWPPEIPAS